MGARMPAMFCRASDEDWFTFEVSMPVERVTIETLALGAGVDTAVELFAADGRTLLGDNDDRDRITNDVLASRVTRLLSRGTYLVRVRNLGVSGAGAQYDVRVSSVTVATRSVFLPLTQH
jgi:hypothetical protein